jgi:glycosyltransferase involved in cell wall biosynthesis
VFLSECFDGDVKVLPNGVDDHFFRCFELRSRNDHLASKYPFASGDYIVCLANYGKLKNQKDLILAYLWARQGVDLVFIGSRKNFYYMFLDLLRKISGCSGRIHLLIGLSQLDILLILERAKLFAYSSLLEAFPLVICQSIVVGTPWISYDVGCVSRLPGGSVCNANNPVILAKLIVESLSDQCKLDYLRAECQAEADNFRYPIIVNDFLRSLVSYGNLA